MAAGAVLWLGVSASALAGPDSDPSSQPTKPPTTLQLLGNLVARPSIGGDCAALWDPSTNRFLYTKNPDKPCAMGSTAKIMTIIVALRALREYRISSQDVVYFSAKAADQGCTCLGQAADNQDPSNTNDFGSDDTVFEPLEYHNAPNERMPVLSQVLDGVAMSAAQPTVAIAEHVANRSYGLAPATTTAESTERERQFVSMMNAEARRAGLKNTRFANEHGGDLTLDFSDDPSVRPQTTARDFVRLFNYGVKSDSRFLYAVGLRLRKAISIWGNGNLRLYTFPSPAGPKWYGYYPGIDGDKSGGSQRCLTCLVSQATRLGRTLVADVMGSPNGQAWNDSGKMYAYGFSRLFTPQSRSVNHANRKSRGVAIDCYGQHRCLTITGSKEGEGWIDAWAPDLPKRRMRYLATANLGNQKGQGSLTSVDIAHLGQHRGLRRAPGGRRSLGRDNLFVTLSNPSTAQPRPRLQAWLLKNTGGLRRLSSVTLGSAEGQSGARVARLGPSRLATALRAADGRLIITTWDVTSSGALKKIASTTSSFGPVAAEFDIAAGSPGLVAAVRSVPAANQSTDTPTPLKLISHRLAGGAPQRVGDSGNSGPAVLQIRLTQQAGRDYATASTTPNGNRTSVRVDLWSTQGDSLAGRGTMGPFPESAAEPAIAPLGTTSGQVLAVNEGGRARFSPVEHRSYFQEDAGPPEYYRLGSARVGSSSTGGLVSVLDVDRLDTTRAKGAFVAAYLMGQKLHLRLYAIAPK